MVSTKVSLLLSSGSSEGEWSTSGCSVSSNNATHTVCKCNHLSTFTILMVCILCSICIDVRHVF